MSTEKNTPTLVDPDKRAPTSRSGSGRLGSWLAGIGLLAFIGLFVAASRTELDPRVANPNTEGRPRPVEYLFGVTGWMGFIQVATALMLAILSPSSSSGGVAIPVVQ